MKNYGLYLKGNMSETINKVKAESIEDAVILLSKIKKISKKNLVDIWEIKEISE